MENQLTIIYVVSDSLEKQLSWLQKLLQFNSILVLEKQKYPLQ